MFKEICFVLLLNVLGIAKIESNELTVRVIQALRKNLDYFYENIDVMNIDALFGLMFAQVNLESLGEKEEIVEDLKKKILDITERVDQSLLAVDDKLFFRFVVKAKLWQTNTTFVFENFDNNSVTNSSDPKTCKDFLMSLISGNFTEASSDKCIVQLIKSSIITPAHCHVDDFCVDYMINGTYEPAYGVTHRLLFLQLARIRLCNWSENWIKEKTRQYCSSIYREAKHIAECGFLPFLDDLLLEQILLCGYEGYSDFLDNKWIDHVLRVQRSSGCFGRLGDRKRKTRKANLISDECTDHTTGLGSGVLSLFLKYLKENPGASKDALEVTTMQSGNI